MKINKIREKDYRGTVPTGNRNNKFAYFDNNLWIVKTNKTKHLNDVKSKLTVHRQTVLAEYYASTLFEKINLIPVQHTELALNENSEICVCCKDFRENEELFDLDSKSSRETANEKEFVNDFDNYFSKVIIPRVNYDNVRNDLLDNYYKYLAVYDFIVANPDRHLGNIAYLISRDTGNARISPAFDFGAGLASNVRFYFKDGTKITPEYVINDAEINNINKCMQNFNGVHISIDTVKDYKMPLWFYEYSKIVLETDILNKAKVIWAEMLQTELFDELRLTTAFRIVQNRIDILYNTIQKHENNLSAIDELNKLTSNH